MADPVNLNTPEFDYLLLALLFCAAIALFTVVQEVPGTFMPSLRSRANMVGRTSYDFSGEAALVTGSTS